MNVANLIILIIAVLILAVVLGVIGIAIRASRRRPVTGGGPVVSTGNSSILLALSLMIGFSLVAYYHNAITGLFVSEETVSDLKLLLSPVFWVGIIGLGVTTLSMFRNAGVLGPDNDLLSGENARKTLVGGSLLVGTLLLFFFWGPIADWTTAFLFESDAGVATGVADNDEAQSFIRTWFWVVPLALIWWLWKRSQPKVKKGPFSTVGDNIALVAFGVPFLALCAIVAVPLLAIFAGLADWASGGRVQDVIDRATGQYERTVEPAANCTTTAPAPEAIRVDELGRNMVICPNSGPIIFYVPYGMHANISWNERWYNDNFQVMQGRASHVFFQMYQPGYWPGSGATSARIDPIPAGFEPTGLDAVEIFVRAMPPTR